MNKRELLIKFSVQGGADLRTNTSICSFSSVISCWNIVVSQAHSTNRFWVLLYSLKQRVDRLQVQELGLDPFQGRKVLGVSHRMFYGISEGVFGY
jgi:hypothetical protein